MFKNKKKIIVVGGGPAGMMAAIRAGELGKKVVLLEKNRSLGKKLLITGNSRCNLTNTYDLETFLSKIPGNGNFLRNAFKKMFNNELLEFFSRRGVRFVSEKGHKIFPLTSKAETILEVLVKDLTKNHITIKCSVAMTTLIVRDKKIKALKCSDGSVLDCDSIIIATGGITYPATGSTGDGIKIAKELDLEIVKPRPALVPMETVQEYPKLIEGLTCQNINLKFISECGKKVSLTGDLIFTAFGISGPVVLSLSSTVSGWLERNNKVSAEIDLMPELTREETETFLLKEFSENSGKSVKNTLRTLLSARMVDLFLRIADITPDKKTGNITREERKKLLDHIKKFTLDIKKIKGISHAVITRGGVSLKEIDPRTMGAKKIEGLYFAGEVIDVDGDTGGFNLQIAFSTGYLAGENA